MLGGKKSWEGSVNSMEYKLVSVLFDSKIDSRQRLDGFSGCFYVIYEKI